MSGEELTNTQESRAPLADRIVESTQRGEYTSAFHDEINSLTNDERLQLVRDLSRITSQSNNHSRGLYVDATIDKTDGMLVDIDIVGIDAARRTRTRYDLFTPGEAGAAYDRRQQIQEKTRPFEEDFRYRGGSDLAFFEIAEELRDAFKGDKERTEIYKVFKERTFRPGANRFAPVIREHTEAANRSL